MEEEGLSCDGGDSIAEGSHLSLGQGCELAGDLHVFFELRDVVTADDHCTDWEREGIAHGFAHVQRAGVSSDDCAFKGFLLLLLDGRRSPAGEDTAACDDLHPDNTHLLFDSEGKELVGEGVGVVSVGCVKGHQDSVEGVAVDHVDDGFGVVVGGNAEKADDLLVVHLGEGVHRSAFGEDGVDLLRDADVMVHPEVEMVGLHKLQGFFDISESAVAGALPALGGKEDVVAAMFHDAPYVLLAPALGKTVSGGSVDEVDTEVEGSLDERNGNIKIVGLFDSALAAEGEDSDLIAGLSEVARGHGSLRLRIRRQRRKLVRHGVSFVGEKACGEDSSRL